ncbi:isoprenyl transferase [Bacteroidales bacterium OttesenSCG-928-K03]|nr:isoprenyl transferase [Odoribacter sp. OttesenSCG-928-L07]MDL2239021.1 isoprenyl transferase [Bacteroidales bacterium OttesenSCG-928-L14]MDL2241061.1 isoprenyl transferase [Bacteroidales bacterium OttesenSCG-928-K22]MDL2242141.1 isoprenyl transferase [Bacteroidales bacterium OttesenSCG-928-K03]
MNDKSLPKHIAIIMDGNGRWATMRGESRSYGHFKGTEAVDEAIQGCLSKNIPFLTLYAFSTENNKRPEDEVNNLMKLAVDAVNDNIDRLNENKVKVNVIGNLETMVPEVVEKYKWCMKETENNDKLTLTLAFNYSSRDEITRATKKITQDVINNKITSDDINEELISKYLDTNNLPDPDMIIRTGGEKRLSNFLLWQASYAELYVTDTLWPDFKKENLLVAIDDFMNRERRFGLVTNKNFKDEK